MNENSKNYSEFVYWAVQSPLKTLRALVDIAVRSAIHSKVSVQYIKAFKNISTFVRPNEQSGFSAIEKVVWDMMHSKQLDNLQERRNFIALNQGLCTFKLINQKRFVKELLQQVVDYSILVVKCPSDSTIYDMLNLILNLVMTVLTDLDFDEDDPLYVISLFVVGQCLNTVRLEKKTDKTLQLSIQCREQCLEIMKRLMKNIKGLPLKESLWIRRELNEWMPGAKFAFTNENFDIFAIEKSDYEALLFQIANLIPYFVASDWSKLFNLVKQTDVYADIVKQRQWIPLAVADIFGHALVVSLGLSLVGCPLKGRQTVLDHCWRCFTVVLQQSLNKCPGNASQLISLYELVWNIIWSLKMVDSESILPFLTFAHNLIINELRNEAECHQLERLMANLCLFQNRGHRLANASKSLVESIQLKLSASNQSD